MNLADLHKIENTPQPTAGMGLVLDVNGKLPVGVAQTIAGYVFDYVENTSSTSVTATTEGTANTVVTGSSLSYDGAKTVEIQFFAMEGFTAPTVGASLSVWLYEDGSSIGKLGTVTTPAASNMGVTLSLARRLTPTAGTHTYSIRASVSSGTGGVSAGAGGSGNLVPAFIKIVRAT